MGKQVSEEKVKLAVLLRKAFTIRRNYHEKHGDYRYTQKRMANEIGLKGDTAFSDWLNETDATMPTARYAPILARMIDEMNKTKETRLLGDDGQLITGSIIYDLLRIEEPMPNDPDIRAAIRLMQERPDLKPILKHLIKRPDDLPKFKTLMEQLDDQERQPANNHHAENGVAPA